MLFILKVSVAFGLLCPKGASANFMELVGEALSPLMHTGKALMRAVKAHQHAHQVQMSVEEDGSVQQVIQQFQIGEGLPEAKGYLFMPAFYDTTQVAATPPVFMGDSFVSEPHCFVSLIGKNEDPVSLQYGAMPQVTVDSTVVLGGPYNGMTTYQISVGSSCMVPSNTSVAILIQDCSSLDETGLWYFVCGDRHHPGLLQLQWLGSNNTELCFHVGPDLDENNNSVEFNAPTPDGQSCGSSGWYDYPHMSLCQASLLGVSSHSVQAVGTTLNSYQCGAAPFQSR